MSHLAVRQRVGLSFEAGGAGFPAVMESLEGAAGFPRVCDVFLGTTVPANLTSQVQKVVDDVSLSM